MKTISRAAFCLRVIGAVLLCVAIALSGYAAIMSSAPWGQVAAKLREVGADTGIVARVGFTSRYYDALSAAVARERVPEGVSRATVVGEKFAAYSDGYSTAQAASDAEAVEAVYAYFLSEFDFAAFAEQYEAREDNAEQLSINKLYAAFDAVGAPAKPKGKALPNLNAGQSEPFFTEYYAAFVAEHGETETGTYYEFLQAVENMLSAYVAENAVSSAKSYMETAFTYEAYIESRAAVQSAEQTAQKNSFLAAFAEMAEALPESGADRQSLTAFFEGEFDHVLTLYPQARYATFVSSARTLIDSGAAYDGSYMALVATEQSADEARESASFQSFLNTFSRDLVAEADKRAGIGIVAALWRLSALRLYLWVAGIALFFGSTLMKKALYAGLMKKQEFRREPEDPDVLLRVEHVKQYFKSGEYVNKAVDDVSFFIKKGEVFGLVGESGCGKTTTGRTIINLYDPTDGDVYFEGLRISSTLNGAPVMQYQERAEWKARVKALRAETKAEIARDPSAKDAAQARCKREEAELRKAYAERAERIQKHAYESEEEKRRSQQLYRDMRKAELTKQYEAEISSLSGEAAADRKRRYETEMAVASRDNIMAKMQMIFQDPIASINPRMTVREIIAEGLLIRGVKDKKYIDEKVYEMLELVGLVPEHADRYPHEFSGGQRQRIGIARAIALEPELIIADEPISALDVSIQAQVINLLNELRNKMGLTILFIAHNLSVVKYFSDRIAVMYYGHIVEMTTSDELFAHPLHPYTKSLLSAIPYPDPHYEKTRKRIEYVPALQHDYSTDKPTMREITPGHFIHCNEAEFARYRKELGL